MVAAGTRKVEEVIDSRQLENVIDNITKQVVHTTQVTAQDCQIQQCRAHMALSEVINRGCCVHDLSC